jgi:hypothetical protein
MDAEAQAPRTPVERGEPAAVSTRRYVPVGKRIVPLSVLIAVVATAAAAVFAWRLFSPQWAGGVGRVDKAPQPPASKMPDAPGPDNSIKSLPPPGERKPAKSGDTTEKKR